MDTPSCPECGRVLDRIDHYGIEHLILRDDLLHDERTYAPVGIEDGDGQGGFGLASEVDLRCGYCGTSVPRESRQYFYQRWYAILELNRAEPTP